MNSRQVRPPPVPILRPLHPTRASSDSQTDTQKVMPKSPPCTGGFNKKITSIHIGFVLLALWCIGSTARLTTSHCAPSELVVHNAHEKLSCAPPIQYKATWCTTQVSGAQCRSLVHKAALYHCSGAPCRSGTTNPHKQMNRQMEGTNDNLSATWLIKRQTLTVCNWSFAISVLSYILTCADL